MLSFIPLLFFLPTFNPTFWLQGEEEAYDICRLSVKSHCISGNKNKKLSNKYTILEHEDMVLQEGIKPDISSQLKELC